MRHPVQGNACLQFQLFFFFLQSIATNSDKSNCKCSTLPERESGAVANCSWLLSQQLLDFPELEMLLFFILELFPILFPLFVSLIIFWTCVNVWNSWNKTFCCALCEKVLPCARTGCLVSPTPCPCTAGSSVSSFPVFTVLPSTTYPSLRLFLQFSLHLSEK